MSLPLNEVLFLRGQWKNDTNDLNFVTGGYIFLKHGALIYATASESFGWPEQGAHSWGNRNLFLPQPAPYLLCDLNQVT